MLKRLFLIGLLILLSVSLAHAQPAQLWKTGQTAFSVPGDDGDWERGVAWPSPRFTVDGTGNCITDNLTSLMWVKAPDSTTRTWADALTYANGLSLCGYTDWRLPNRKELRSLVDYSKFTPALPTGHPFTNVQADADYWSSTTSSTTSARAWSVNMDYGIVYYYGKTASYYVWPVRAGSGNSVIAVAVPTMTEWGMIIFMLLAGLGAVYYLRRQVRN